MSVKQQRESFGKGNFVRRLFGTLGVGALSAFGTIVVTPSTAFATDNYPCSAPWRHPRLGIMVHTCPDWSPAINNDIPVYYGASPSLQGYIHAPWDDWYVCQMQGPTAQLQNYYNDWWAWTMADNGLWGWVSETYFRGGPNFEPD